MHTSFVHKIVLMHGPTGDIGRHILAADTATRNEGITLSFATFDELMSVNLANSQTWRPLFTVFDRTAGGFGPDTSFCLFGRNAADEIVATQAARFFDWSGTSLVEESRSLRMIYRDPPSQALPGEAIEVTAPYAMNITGKVAYTGAQWFRPDFRRRNLSAILSPLARSIALTLWNIDLAFTFMIDDVRAKGVARRARYFNEESGVQLKNTRLGSHTGVLLWKLRNDIIDDARAFFSRP